MCWWRVLVFRGPLGDDYSQKVLRVFLVITTDGWDCENRGFPVSGEIRTASENDLPARMEM